MHWRMGVLRDREPCALLGKPAILPNFGAGMSVSKAIRSLMRGKWTLIGYMIAP